MELIDKNKLLEELKKLKQNLSASPIVVIEDVESLVESLELKEVNIADMADDYYDGLMEEVADWMDEGTMCHCRLAYYIGCKDVLAKLQKGE